MEELNWFQSIMAWADSLPAWITAFTALVTGATAITALTPTTADDRVVNAILKVLNFLAGNVLKNRNADASTAK